MKMDDVFDKLKSLQEILVKKYEIEAKLRDEPSQINSLRGLLDRIKKEYIEKDGEYENAKSKMFELRTDLDAAMKLLESGEKGMDNISTHREYEALKIQITEATEKEKTLREKLKQQEKIVAEKKEELVSTEEMMAAQEKEIADRQAGIDKNLEKYNKELMELNKKADKVKPGLDDEIVFKFERITRRNSDGIVPVLSARDGKYGVCKGCHMILPAQFVNKVHEGESIYFCPYCSRVLFYEESTDQDDMYYEFDDDDLLIDDDDVIDEMDDDDDDDDKSQTDGHDSDSSDDDDDDGPNGDEKD